jgi:hypothetical protein
MQFMTHIDANWSYVPQITQPQCSQTSVPKTIDTPYRARVQPIRAARGAWHRRSSGLLATRLVLFARIGPECGADKAYICVCFSPSYPAPCTFASFLCLRAVCGLRHNSPIISPCFPRFPACQRRGATSHGPEVGLVELHNGNARTAHVNLLDHGSEYASTPVRYRELKQILRLSRRSRHNRLAVYT